jgi:hypothetical protein
MFLDGVELAAGWLRTAGLVCKLIDRFVSVHGDWDQSAVLADSRFDQVASVIVLSHPDRLPGYLDPIAITVGLDMLRRSVQGGMRQFGVGDYHGFDVAADLYYGCGYPAVAIEILGLNPQPGTGIIASVDFRPVTFI